MSLVLAAGMSLGGAGRRAEAQIGPLQFDFDLTAAVGGGSNFGAVHVGSDLWVSRWPFGFSEFHRIDDQTGALIEGPITVPGLIQPHGLAWDGASIWACTESPTLVAFDPVTRTINTTITIASGIPAIYAAWDPLADGGQGGFWVGDWSSDIELIDLAGNTIDVLPAAAMPAYTSRAGAVVDRVSPGGPWLWVFDQDFGTGVLVQVDLSSGTPSGVTLDVGAALGGGLAGGLFLASGIVPGTATLGGVLQGFPDRLFGYELTVPPANDECSGAILLQHGTQALADNTSATTAASDPPFSCHFAGPNQGVGTLWYRFVASDTSAYLTTCGSTDPTANDSLLAVYEGTCGNLTEIACSEDDCTVGSGFNSELCVTGLTPGETYYVQLAAYGGSNVGAYGLLLTHLCPECPAESIYSTPLQYFDGVPFAISDGPLPAVALDRFVAGGGPVCSAGIWAASFDFQVFQACVEDPMEVEIAFYDDAGGAAGELRARYRTALDGILPAELFGFRRFDIDLESIGGCCELSTGWLAVQGFGGFGNCGLVWGGASGDGLLSDLGAGLAPVAINDLTMCLVTDDAAGACCIYGEVCTTVTQARCLAQDGLFLGAGTACADFPCGRSILKEPFIYASNARLEEVWSEGSATQPAGYSVHTGFGNPNTSYFTPHQVIPIGDRLVHGFELDEKPGPGEALVLEYDLYLDGAGAGTSWASANHWIEIGGHSGDDFGVGSHEIEIRFGVLESGLAFSDPYSVSHFQALVLSTSGALGVSLDEQPGAPLRTTGWHRLRCQITKTTIGSSDAWKMDFFVDGVLAESEIVPGSQGFDWVRLGSGFLTGGLNAWIDNIDVEMVPLTLPPPPCPGDANHDGVVNSQDLVLVILNWGCSGVPGSCPADVDYSGGVGVQDLVVVILNWGLCP